MPVPPPFESRSTAAAWPPLPGAGCEKEENTKDPAEDAGRDDFRTFVKFALCGDNRLE